MTRTFLRPTYDGPDMIVSQTVCEGCNKFARRTDAVILGREVLELCFRCQRKNPTVENVIIIL